MDAAVVLLRTEPGKHAFSVDIFHTTFNFKRVWGGGVTALMNEFLDWGGFLTLLFTLLFTLDCTSGYLLPFSSL